VSQRATLEGMADDGKREPQADDVVLLGGPTDDGEGVRVLRARQERVEVGEVRPMKEGKPLTGGEIVKLVPRAKSPRVCDVEVLAKVSPPASASPARVGPAQVATHEYRESWERIFGGEEKRAAGMLN
jgi:hypothetical protein